MATTPVSLYHYQKPCATTPVSVQGTESLPAIKGHHPCVGSGGCITTSNQGPPPQCWFRGLYHYQQPRATTSVRIQGTGLVVTGEHQCGGSRRKLHFLWWEPFPKTNSDANHTCKYFPTLGVIWPKMHTTRQNELPVQNFLIQEISRWGLTDSKEPTLTKSLQSRTSTVSWQQLNALGGTGMVSLHFKLSTKTVSRYNNQHFQHNHSLKGNGVDKTASRCWHHQHRLHSNDSQSRHERKRENITCDTWLYMGGNFLTMAWHGRQFPYNASTWEAIPIQSPPVQFRGWGGGGREGGIRLKGTYPNCFLNWFKAQRSWQHEASCWLAQVKITPYYLH